jgi:hypothetical protein
MTDPIIKVREHYSATGLTDRMKAALATIAPESQALTVAQLAPLDTVANRSRPIGRVEQKTNRAPTVVSSSRIDDPHYGFRHDCVGFHYDHSNPVPKLATR